MSKERVLILGAGEAGKLLAFHFSINQEHNIQLVGMLDDVVKDVSDVLTQNFILGGLDQIQEVCRTNQVDRIIVAIPTLEQKRKQELLNECAELEIKTQLLPEISDIVQNGANPIVERSIEYSDLLNREVNELDYQKLSKQFKEKVVLISGAGGSIGSEIAKQVAKCGPKKIILLGHGENSIYVIAKELQEENINNICSVIADVQDQTRIEEVFKTYTPDIVYHAAAHKHVPMMEMNIKEAIKNNVLGTKNMVEAAAANAVERFIMISTDKTVHPTSVMGATKKIAEWLVQLENETTSKTIFSVVRFGNVLGSRGSAIPLFWGQIQNNKPITVTHPEMERYFMTIPEASQLVIEAGFLAKGNEIFILKMGEPQKIIDIIHKMITLSGKSLQEIEITFTGLRNGEKIKEELFEEQEAMQEINDRFYCGQSQVPYSRSEIDWMIQKLLIEDSEKIKEKLLNMTIYKKEYIHYA